MQATKKRKTTLSKVTKAITPVTQRDTTKKVQLTGDSLISFVSGCQTNIGRSTFYNMADEQKAALIGQHVPVLEQARAFYTLMSLPEGINDVNKQVIAYNLMKNTFREKDLKDHEHSPTTIWENAVLLQTLLNMQPNRVFDLFVNIRQEKITKNRAMRLIYTWLMKNKDKLEFWAIKYRKDVKSILKHLRHNSKNAFNDPLVTRVWEYLRNDKTEGCSQIILDYVAVQKGDKTKLAKLPRTVAEGFKQKFKISDSDFETMFKEQGGQFTAKEKRQKAAAVERSGGTTELDIRKLELFDLLVYLRARNDEGKLPDTIANIKKLIESKAEQASKRLLFKLDDVGCVLDTSISMVGTKEQPFHPFLRAFAISKVLKYVSTNFKFYLTNESDNNALFPKISNQSNYGDAILKALKGGCKTLIIIGDGYENAPFEGFAHEILFEYKQNIDKNLVVLHFNPVFASESMDVRSLSNLAPQIGVRDVKAMNESMFLAIAKQKPLVAIQGYMKYLYNLQNDEAKRLMPNELKKIVEQEQALIAN